MSRTKRIYNSEHWKWHAEQSLRMRYTFIAPWNYYTTDGNGWIYAGFVYHPYKETCMGHCHFCRKLHEKEKGWRRKRYRLKYELRLELHLIELYGLRYDDEI